MASAVVATRTERRNREPSSISSLSSGINHEVFLNFRGKDTRKEFTDVLHNKLKKAGIEVFKDDEKLRAGDKISQGLKDAIKRSRISIAIFSKNYASSEYCLMELVQMWECRELDGQIIIPIFYDVMPYAVKKQVGDFATSFEKHEADKKVDLDTIEKWKEVLRQVGELSGFDRALINGGHVTDLLEKVVTRVRQVLKKDDQLVPDKLVGIDLHVQEMMKKLGVVYSNGQAIEVCGEDVRVVGICGMRGVGKTTLAKVVFNKMHELFDGCSFLKGINSERVEVSQEQLIADLQKEKHEALRSSEAGIKIISSRFSNMKVLIMLDDVHRDEQIEALAGKLTWFGPGSRIIVTTNRKNVLKGFDFGAAKNRAAEEYEVKKMGDQDALQLFRKHAFQGDPQDVYDYDSLSGDIVKALGGLPMAIVLRANYLKKKNDLEIWRSTRDSINNHSEGGEVEAAFKASYDYLDDHTKEIFLDIACFFIGKDERITFYMWEACGYTPAKGIDSLRDLHLLEDGENNELRMHDLIRDFGRDIVKRKKDSKRCRFWNHSDSRSILKICTRTESVEGFGLNVKGIGLTVEEDNTDCFTCEEFCNMLRLRYLRLDRAEIQGNTEKLPPNLRWLAWRWCHLIPELCNMHLEELVILDLSWSPVTMASKFWEQILEKVGKLKVLNLRGCVQLRPSLKFPAPSNLEMLIMEDCTKLSQIRLFIKGLKKLSSLNLRNCSQVTNLPKELYCMESLRELVIDGTGIQEIYCQGGSLENLETLSARNCTSLKNICTIDCLSNLSSLALDGADIGGLPDAFEFPRKLKRLSLRNCQMLVKLPPSIGNLKLLEEMDLSYTKITEIPSSVKELTELKTLKMAGTHLKKFPQDIVKLAKLEEIDFSLCVSLEGNVRCDISKLSSLRILRYRSSNVAGLPPSIHHLSRLQTLDIFDCNRLHALPKLPLPSSLLCLRWGSKNMTVRDLSYLTNLKELLLTDGEQPKAGWLMMLWNLIVTPNIGWITRLTSLETLELSLSNVTSLPGNFSALTQLRELSLSYMKELDLTQLPSTSSLWTLRLKHCKIRKPKFSGLIYLSKLELEDCDSAEIDGLEDLKLLEILKISRCKGITNLNGLKNLPCLRKVKGIFSARPSLPMFSHPVELDILPQDSSASVA